MRISSFPSNLLAAFPLQSGQTVSKAGMLTISRGGEKIVVLKDLKIEKVDVKGLNVILSGSCSFRTQFSLKEFVAGQQNRKSSSGTVVMLELKVEVKDPNKEVSEQDHWRVVPIRSPIENVLEGIDLTQPVQLIIKDENGFILWNKVLPIRKEKNPQERAVPPVSEDTKQLVS